MTNIQRLLSLVAQLPEGVRASDRETNHFELTTPEREGFWWLDVAELLDPSILTEPQQMMAPQLDRLQLLLDLAEAAKAAEWQLRAMQITIEEHDDLNPLHNDQDAYLLAMIEWTKGVYDEQPIRSDYGL